VTPPAVILPLTDDEVAGLRADGGAGKRRRVVLLVDSAGIPAGKAGEVTRVGQPDVDGSDFIGVRIGGDDLFFSPTEVALPGVRRGPAGEAKGSPRGRRLPADVAPEQPRQGGTTARRGQGAARVPQEAARAPQEAAAGARTPATGPAVKAPASKAPAVKAPATKAPASEPAAASSAATSARTAPARQSALKQSALKQSPAEQSALKQAVTKPAGRAGRKPPRLPAVAITIRSTDAGWTVEAQRGGKSVLKATAVRAGTVQEIADALDEDPVTAVVHEVLAARRAVAEAEAEELRQALARAEAILAEYESGH
jgi:hypothetical protein